MNKFRSRKQPIHPRDIEYVDEIHIGSVRNARMVRPNNPPRSIDVDRDSSWPLFRWVVFCKIATSSTLYHGTCLEHNFGI